MIQLPEIPIVNDQQLVHLLQQKIEEDIPLVRHMGVAVVEYKKHRLILSAPLHNNINHQKTVFGGSLSSLATLACWGLVYLELYQQEIRSNIVIQKGQIEYIQPTEGDFQAVCSIDDGDRFNRFLSMLRRKGVGRIKLTSEIICQKVSTSLFEGSFVANII